MISPYSALFESRRMEKAYLAVVAGLQQLEGLLIAAAEALFRGLALGSLEFDLGHAPHCGCGREPLAAMSL